MQEAGEAIGLRAVHLHVGGGCCEGEVEYLIEELAENVLNKLVGFVGHGRAALFGLHASSLPWCRCAVWEFGFGVVDV